MPGHFVQGLTLRAHPEWSLVRRAAQSYATTEGWAHYAEQMMVDQGFGDGDPRVRLMQLQDALLRDCRLIDAFGLHTGSMTLAKATELMQTECFQSPGSAYKEARRGTEDPGYYAYTLGKLMILHLRDDLQRSQGAAFSLTRLPRRPARRWPGADPHHPPRADRPRRSAAVAAWMAPGGRRIEVPLA